MKMNIWLSMQALLEKSSGKSEKSATRVGKKWYFEHLDIHGIKCNLTLIPKTMHSDEAGAQRARLTTVYGVHFIDINNVSLKINALQMRNAFVTWRSLLATIYRHLFFQVSHFLMQYLQPLISQWMESHAKRHVSSSTEKQ